jgi:D-amino-acid dehydrogenase
MHVVVIGAGIIGNLSAYYLSELGYEVTIIERNNDISVGATNANAYQLSFGYMEPMASFDNLKKIINIARGREPVIKFQNCFDWEFYTWMIRFILQADPYSFNRNRNKLIDLAIASKCELESFLRQNKVKMTFNKSGKLHLLEDGAQFSKFKKLGQILGDRKYEQRILQRTDISGIEPMLDGVSSQYIAAAFAPADLSSDPKDLSQNIFNYFKKYNKNVKYLFNKEVTNFNITNNIIDKITINDDEEIAANAILICAGAYTNNVLKLLDKKLPIYPVKGYSYDIVTDGKMPMPKVNITDHKRRVAFSPTGKNKMRLSSFFEFSPVSDDVTTMHLSYFERMLYEVFPEINVKKFELHSGLRPCTPDSLPVVGQRFYDNLYFNVGHGSLGWTLSFGTCKNIADIIS